MPRTNIADPLQTVGGLFAMAADAVTCVFRRPFQTREFVTRLGPPTNYLTGVGRHCSGRTGI